MSKNREKMEAVKAALDQHQIPVRWEAAWNPGTGSRAPSFDIGGKTMCGHQFFCYVPFSESAFETMTVEQLTRAVMTDFWVEIDQAFWDLKSVRDWFEDWVEQNDIGVSEEGEQ